MLFESATPQRETTSTKVESRPFWVQAQLHLLKLFPFFISRGSHGPRGRVIRLVILVSVHVGTNFHPQTSASYSTHNSLQSLLLTIPSTCVLASSHFLLTGPTTSLNLSPIAQYPLTPVKPPFSLVICAYSKAEKADFDSSDSDPTPIIPIPTSHPQPREEGSWEMQGKEGKWSSQSCCRCC